MQEGTEVDDIPCPSATDGDTTTLSPADVMVKAAIEMAMTAVTAFMTGAFKLPRITCQGESQW